MSETGAQPSPPGSPPPAPVPTPSPTPIPAPTEVKPSSETPKPPVALTADAIKLPDGLGIDKPLMDEFVGLMNDEKLPANERAQKLVDLQVRAMQAVHESGNKLWDETQAKWTEEAKADPVIGGEKLAPVLGNVAKLIDKYSVNDKGEPDTKFAAELREALDLTGAGNHPRLIRFLNNVAQDLVVEGKLIPGAPATVTGDPASILYPNQGKTV